MESVDEASMSGVPELIEMISRGTRFSHTPVVAEVIFMPDLRGFFLGTHPTADAAIYIIRLLLSVHVSLTFELCSVVDFRDVVHANLQEALTILASASVRSSLRRTLDEPPLAQHPGLVRAVQSIGDHVDYTRMFRDDGA